MIAVADHPRLETWLENRLHNSGAVRIELVERIPGGASMETYRLRCRIGGSEVRSLILRKSPASTLIETEREVEYAAYVTFSGTEIPVPEPIGLESGWEILDGSFFVASDVQNCHAAPTVLDDSVWDIHRRSLGKQFWEILGGLARAEPSGTSLARILPGTTRHQAWSEGLTHWAHVVAEDEIVPDPLLHSAIGALWDHPPAPPQRISIVHGDYRTGNVLFDDDGQIRAILDWEMCHLGDPLEDVAWALSPLWSGCDPSVVGRLVSRQVALDTWSETSGLEIERHSLAWWELFAAVKGAAIWLSAGAECSTGRNQDLMMLQAAWLPGIKQERILAEKLIAFLEED